MKILSQEVKQIVKQDLNIKEGAQPNVIEGIKVNNTQINPTNKIVTIPNASTSTYGVTKLNNSTTSTSTTEAATAQAVRNVNYSAAKIDQNNEFTGESNTFNYDVNFGRKPKIQQEGYSYLYLYDNDSYQFLNYSISFYANFERWNYDLNDTEYKSLYEAFSDLAFSMFRGDDGWYSSYDTPTFSMDPYQFGTMELLTYNSESGDYEHWKYAILSEYDNQIYYNYDWSNNTLTITLKFVLVDSESYSYLGEVDYSAVISAPANDYLNLTFYKDYQYFTDPETYNEVTAEFSTDGGYGCPPYSFEVSTDPNSPYYNSEYEYDWTGYQPTLDSEVATMADIPSTDSISNSINGAVSTHNSSSSAHSSLFNAKLAASHATDANAHLELAQVASSSSHKIYDTTTIDTTTRGVTIPDTDLPFHSSYSFIYHFSTTPTPYYALGTNDNRETFLVTFSIAYQARGGTPQFYIDKRFTGLTGNNKFSRPADMYFAFRVSGDSSYASRTYKLKFKYLLNGTTGTPEYVTKTLCEIPIYKSSLASSSDYSVVFVKVSGIVQSSLALTGNVSTFGSFFMVDSIEYMEKPYYIVGQGLPSSVLAYPRINFSPNDWKNIPSSWRGDIFTGITDQNLQTIDPTKIPIDGSSIVNNNGVLSAITSAPPIATSATAGIVKPDGTTITVDANGVISASGGGGGSGFQGFDFSFPNNLTWIFDSYEPTYAPITLVFADSTLSVLDVTQYNSLKGRTFNNVIAVVCGKWTRPDDYAFNPINSFDNFGYSGNSGESWWTRGLQVTINNNKHFIVAVADTSEVNTVYGPNNLSPWDKGVFTPMSILQLTGNAIVEHLFAWTECLLKGTLIYLTDGKVKPIEEVTYEDELLVWDFDNGCLASAKPLWIKKAQTSPFYFRNEFSDGRTLMTVGEPQTGGHRLFNLTKNKFTYSMDTVGNEVYSLDGKLNHVSCNRIDEPCEYYNVITEKHFNLFANGILTSCRLNNLYPIKDMKFVKDNRELRPIEAYNVPLNYYKGLRLAEQTVDPNKVNKYIDNLIKVAQ